MVAEFYSGLAVALGGTVFRRSLPRKSPARLEAYLQNDVSFNFIWCMEVRTSVLPAVANYDKKRDMQPDLTSYDYDALLARPVGSLKI